MRKILSITIGLFLLFGCRTNSYVFTQKIKNTDTYQPEGIIYYLPKTKIIIDVQAVKIVENKGPYADYAEEFLGNLKNIIKENRTYWQISDIQIKTQPVRDTNNIWLFNAKNLSNYSFSLTPQGFPIAINYTTPEVNNYTSDQQTFIQKQRTTDSTENLLVIDRGYKEVYDTIFKIEQYDTIQRTVPIIEKKFIKKSIREQARELADKIFALRDDREALLVGEGDSDELPDGQALTVMLQGIDKLEREYLAQFIGRTDKTIYHFRFEFIPEPTNDVIQKVLFRFSQKYGILPAQNLKGQPIIIEIQSNKTTESLKNWLKQQQLLKRIENIKDPNKGLAYRVPEIVLIKIKQNKQILAQAQLPIAQFGVINFLPATIFKTPVQILFYPELGTIRQIRVNQR